MTDTFAFFTEFRGFHVYCNTVNWVPYVGQIIIFKREYNNKHDRFAVAGKTLFKGRIASFTVEYVPRKQVAQFEATVDNKKTDLLPQCKTDS